MARDVHQIDEYLLGRLRGDALEAFEKEVADDPNFADQVQQRRTLMEKVDAYGDYEVKAQLKNLHQKEMKLRLRRRSLRRWGFALFALLLLAIAYWLWQPQKPSSSQQLYAAHYEPYPLNFAARDGNTERALAEAGRFYRSGQYAKALPLFQSVYQADTTESKVLLAIGICLMEAGQLEDALQRFQPLLQTDFDPFKDQALWYAALVHVKQEERPAAQALLQQIVADPQSDFYQQARDLLAEF
ncbi:MAG: tetratricopeptide repeat protein [Bacteroidota bacterium]